MGIPVPPAPSSEPPVTREAIAGFPPHELEPDVNGLPELSAHVAIMAMKKPANDGNPVEIAKGAS